MACFALLLFGSDAYGVFTIHFWSSRCSLSFCRAWWVPKHGAGESYGGCTAIYTGWAIRATRAMCRLQHLLKI